MKVVMVGPHPEPGSDISGGVERVIDSLLPHLAKRVDLTLVVPGAASDASSSKAGVEIHYIRRGPGPGVVRTSTIDAVKLAQVIRKLKPDLVHLQANSSVGRYLDVPKILTIHGIAHNDLLLSNRGRGWGSAVQKMAAMMLEWTERSARRTIHDIIVINPYVGEALDDIGAKRLWNIPNPLDERFVTVDSEPSIDRRATLIAAGRISPLKNTKRIIEILIEISRTNIHAELLLCGSSENPQYEAMCRALVESNGMSDRIKFLGNLGINELRDRLDRASLLIMASKQETAPMAIAESNSRGVPAIAPDAFGIRYMIQPGKNGFFLPDADVVAQASAVEKALAYLWDRQKIAEDAVRVHASDRIADQTVEAYTSVLARRQSYFSQ